jgi:hypothetical protein
MAVWPSEVSAQVSEHETSRKRRRDFSGVKMISMGSYSKLDTIEKNRTFMKTLIHTAKS